MLGHVTGVQIENKNALINRPCCGDKIFTESGRRGHGGMRSGRDDSGGFGGGSGGGFRHNSWPVLDCSP